MQQRLTLTPLLLSEALIPQQERAQFLHLKGRCYNITSTYDHRALECLSKAVKLDPSLVHAWNELGECYWKNLNLKEAKICFEGALTRVIIVKFDLRLICFTVSI